MRNLFIVWVTILVLANIFMFCITLFFGKEKKDKASKVGFTFMCTLAVANILTVGGLTAWAL